MAKKRPPVNEIVCGDCLKVMPTWPAGSVDLIFADPPFNIGYKYDVYEDRRAYDEYKAWTEAWIAGCTRLLKPEGSMYVAIGDDFAAEVRLAGRDAGLHLRNWIIWNYTFGQATKLKFARSHTHIFYFTKDPRQFTFNAEAVRVLSDRQKEYNDKRSASGGKLPDDTWTQFPRVCGTFDERTEFPCQMPEALLARIIRTSSDPGEIVLDPFGGSGTTPATAHKLGRRYVAVELSPDYAEGIRRRLERIGPEDYIEGEHGGPWPAAHQQELARLYGENELPTDRLFANPGALFAFARQFNARLGSAGGYSVEEIRAKLESLRKAGQLPRIRAHIVEYRNGPPVGSRPPRKFKPRDWWPKEHGGQVSAELGG